MVHDGEKFILSRNEEQRLKNLANGSDENDYESSDEEESDGDNRGDDDDQPTRFVQNFLFSNREGLGTSVSIMGLATIDPHSQKEHTEIYKIP